ncbi:hypothetical protein DRE45_23570 [Salmonella enterica subsp. enterica]|nr:hypothetical protein [Salmonella enterica]EEE9921640.1 hypothetical protein [Salmonella enterica subsp. enterica serovar Javiana]EEP1863874.1 hypothetical protein [Salmonella enterica]EHB4099252.1 hypothetical protein [Salmonella enterica]EIK4415244.1 hypothetical protein [Salmonella enterica]
MRANAQLTRITCAGIVDADDYAMEEIQHLNSLGVFPLPVSEIENLILLPEVSRAIAQTEGYAGAELEQKLSNLQSAIFNSLSSQTALDDVVARYCRRRIDRVLKKVDLSDSKTICSDSLNLAI